MKKNRLLFLVAGLCLIQSIDTHTMLERLRRRSTRTLLKKRPTSATIIPTPGDIPSTKPPQERELPPHPALAEEDEYRMNSDGDYQCTFPLGNATTSRYDSFLQEALNAKRLDWASSLIRDTCAHPNVTDDQGNTFLHLSAKQHNTKYVQNLYATRFRINPNIANTEGETVFHILARQSFQDAAPFATLLLFDEHPNHIPVDIFAQYQGKTPIEIAAYCDNPEMVKMLLRHTPRDHESVQKAIGNCRGETTKRYLFEHITRHPEDSSSASSSLSASPSSSSEKCPSSTFNRPIYGALPEYKGSHPIPARHREKEKEREEEESSDSDIEPEYRLLKEFDEWKEEKKHPPKTEDFDFRAWREQRKKQK